MKAGRGSGVRRAVVAVALAGLLGTLVGCSPASEEDPLSPTARAWLVDHGPIRVAVDRSGPPAALVEDDEVVGGWAVALVELAVLKVGARAEFVPFDSNEDAVGALRDGTVDLLTGVAGRGDLVAFAEPVDTLAFVPIAFAVGPERPEITRPDDLAGRTVTSIPGSVVADRIRSAHPEVDYVERDSIPDAVDAVYRGEVDAWAGPLPMTSHFLRLQGRQTLRVVGAPLDVVEASAWGRADSPVLDVVGAGRALMTDAEMAVIHVQWTGFDLTDPAAGAAPPWILPTLAALLALIVLLGGGTLLLRRQVRVRTAQLAAARDQLEQEVAEQTRELRARSSELRYANTHLMESNEALARFARRAAHDLRGPLAAIRGFADIAARADATEEVRERSMTTISTSATRMADLVNAMLADATQVVPQAGAAIPTAELREWLADFTAVELLRSNATVVLQTDRSRIDLPVSILKQMLVNLVGNALKHAGRDDVTVEVTFSRDDTQGRWRITVDDDGHGIPTDQRELVFDVGYRGSSEAIGSGLGLAACREAAEAHGGTIHAEASPTGGTRIVLALPASATKEGAVVTEPAPRSPSTQPSPG